MNRIEDRIARVRDLLAGLAREDALAKPFVDDFDAIRQALEQQRALLADIRNELEFEPVGWDERKTLAGIWQDHAPLPEEGLTDRVYEALIAVARHGEEPLWEVGRIARRQERPRVIEVKPT